MATVFQTRSESTGVASFNTMEQALNYAKKDETVWKISFSVNNEWFRLVKNEAGEWVYSPLMKD